MTRPKRPSTFQTAADVEAEIRRLEAERQRLIDAEDQRRGALLREYLSAPNGDALRETLSRFASRRDGALFGLAVVADDRPDGAEPRPARRPIRSSSPGAVTASTGA